MNVLIIYTHPNPNSFNQAILDTASTTLREGGHTIRIHDLYQMQFHCVLDGEDLMRNRQGDIHTDIRREQGAVRWAQGLIFIYPIWWFGAPAILKGWIDRVFTRKFAFDFNASGMQGLLHHEKALIINTLGGDEASYREKRWHELLVRPMAEGILHACGVRNISHQAFYQVPTVSHAERQAMLDKVRELTAAF
ncbi:MAG: NAD(P)H dehydrogenase [Candidatus Contendobacter odensis]|uniref:NAD(P)H dehydrogenase n=1 Tax=Candidatus Contendibacter odensensis TaxID=1400860 RepID=A0A2G6PEK5_9GAMM|nr:MAG: NAD(P)H dehydrogenase [Candidatus Contendobacter odensis]